MSESKNKRVAIFASGTGSNAMAIHQHSIDSGSFDIALILSNKRSAGVLNYADKNTIPSVTFNKSVFQNGREILSSLKRNKVDYIVLAGFLWLIPSYLVEAFPKRIINIHPGLLPKYGGKGMYGSIIHQTVFGANDSESGISIHYVNENYDEGDLICQVKCHIDGIDSASEIGEKVLTLEHKFYPQIVEGICT